MTGRKRKPAPDVPDVPDATTATVTVTAARPGIRRVHADGLVFPVGEPVPNVPQSTIQALEGLPTVQVDVAGEPDVDTPETTDQE